uniref:Uncharacterized protein n=1 Tax=Sphaeramia orbicularis TaxID=375764 RepID=A0A673ADE6_9TELE
KTPSKPASEQGTVAPVEELEVKASSLLLFNDGVPASAKNRATFVHTPGAIVIEKLLPLSEEQDIAGSTRSSINFTTLSEERLQAAVKLAKRDVRRKHLEFLSKSPPKPSQELAATPNKSKEQVSSPKEKVAQPRAKSLQHRSQKHHFSLRPRVYLSPPTRDPGPRQPEGQQAPLSQEIRKLQNELEVYIQKVEELANIGNPENHYVTIILCHKIHYIG